MAAIRPRQAISVVQYFKKIGLQLPPPERLLGHEEVITQQILFPALNKLGYDITNQIDPKPQLQHEIVGERREADYGIYPYGTISRKGKLIKLYGMVADVKTYKEELTVKMEEKLAGYCALAGAPYGILTNGELIIVIRPVRGAVDWDYVEEIPKLARLTNELKGYSEKRHSDSDLIYANRIVNVPDQLDEKTIEKIAIDCHNIIRRRSGMQVPDRLYEFSKLFLLRILDEKEYVEGSKRELSVTYKNIQELKEKGVGISEFVNKRFKEVAKKIEIFNENEKITLDEGVIEETIQVLDVHALWLRRLDILAQVYEKFLINTMTGQELGQFFTPRTIVEVMVKMVDPDYGQRILDPSCGMAGFLLYSLFHVMHKVPEKDDVHCEFYGVEIDNSTTKLAKVNSWLHNDSHKNIIRANSFDPAEAPEFLKAALKRPSEKGFDLILTNPPFGSKGKNRYEAETIRGYADGWNKKNGVNLFECAVRDGEFKSCGAQSLFLELCVKALKKPIESHDTGGRLCTVIDYGILSNVQKEEPEIRKIIRRETIIEAVISLPKGTFKVYGSNVVPCILLVRRKQDDEHQGSIFRADVHKIGYIPAIDRYRVESDEDLKIAYECWKKWKPQ